MTQIIDDYIASLATQLNALSAAQKEDALNFYRAFLRNGDCQSKEEILMELGTPAASLAARLKLPFPFLIHLLQLMVVTKMAALFCKIYTCKIVHYKNRMENYFLTI